MSYLGGEEWMEKCQEKLDSQTVDYLTDSNTAMVSFIIHIENMLPPEQFQEMLSGWLKTKDGVAWYEAMLDKLIADRQENDDSDTWEDN